MLSNLKGTIINKLMLLSLVRASLGAECAEFMLKGSKGCKEGLSEYATVEEGIKATSSDCYNIFIGIDNQVVKLSSQSNAKGVSFNGCSANKLGLTYEFDKTDVKPNVAFNSFNVSLSAESNVAFENLTLFFGLVYLIGNAFIGFLYSFHIVIMS